MAKKRNSNRASTSKIKKKEKTEKIKEEQSFKEPENDDTSFDFGGLPQRDLKKNLGCG